MTLSRAHAVTVFLAFAFAYFLSALIRAITATLSPTLTLELSLSASDLGLLAGGYFFGFALMQLPLGKALDHYGPKGVILCFLTVASLGCLAFSAATSLHGLLAARVLCGIGVSACLMAPLTGYRRWLSPSAQLRANSWMLMTGSLGMVASTLPVQWLMPHFGWRPMFWALAAMIAVAMLVIAAIVPAWDLPNAPDELPSTEPPGYVEVLRDPFFRSVMPLGFFTYGGLLAMQTLWAGPWMVNVASYTPLQAATGLFWINVAMLLTFWLWGLLNPWLTKRGLDATRLMLAGLPLNFVALALLLLLGTGPWTALLWALFCMSCSFVSLSQPAVGLAFPSALAGRALSAYNLVIFAGVFVVQWGFGLAVDAFTAIGWSQPQAYRASLFGFLLCNLCAYAWFVLSRRDNPSQ